MDKKKNAFTLVELIVSIFISVIVLGGIFYFVSESILQISTIENESQFLKDLASVSTLYELGNSAILIDYPDTNSDVAIIKNDYNTSGIIIGSVDKNTMQLTKTGSFDIYSEKFLGYRELSPGEYQNILLNPDSAYNLTFFPDKIFSNFFLKNLSLESFNSGTVINMKLEMFPSYSPGYSGEYWKNVSKKDIKTYFITL